MRRRMKAPMSKRHKDLPKKHQRKLDRFPQGVWSTMFRGSISLTQHGIKHSICCENLSLLCCYRVFRILRGH